MPLGAGGTRLPSPASGHVADAGAGRDRVAGTGAVRLIVCQVRGAGLDRHAGPSSRHAGGDAARVGAPQGAAATGSSTVPADDQPGHRGDQAHTGHAAHHATCDEMAGVPAGSSAQALRQLRTCQLGATST